ncbi:MAG: TRAP transporter fused permease subunit, partial [Candidatus Rokubacteria bacterium]|nr:TRAP transporter fused permease subunit [Candidatus Rokubacteria bacterium]
AILLANWFHWGTILTTVIGTVILYFFFGHLIAQPVILRHPPYEVPFVMTYMGLNGTEGVFAFLPDGVEKLYFLVLFAAVMIGSGMISLVTEMGKGVGRFVRGGAAFPAIIGSTMEGMVMGAAVTNVVMSGKLTIPMMKNYGFRKEFAAAVEVSASTAGQIIPPVMGLAAFIMAALLNISYITIALVAVIPAFLYMAGVTIAVLIKSEADDLPKLREPFDWGILRRLLPTFVLPVTIVVVLLLWFYSPSVAGLAGIGAVLALCAFQGPFRPSLYQLIVALKEGFEIAMQLCLLLVAIGPLTQTFVTTNMAGRLSALLVQVLPDSSLVLLLGAMVLTLLFGMGLPTPAAYVLVALTLGHFLQQLGIKPVPAHFFIQYFAVFSAVTPPVALASLAGAKIAGAPFWATAVESFKLVVPAFFVPFAFIYHPALLTFPSPPPSVLISIAAVIGVQFVCSVVLYGFFRRPLSLLERGVFVLAGVPGVVYLVNPEPFYLWVFVAAGGAMVLWVLGGRALRGEVRPALVEPAAEGHVREREPGR